MFKHSIVKCSQIEAVTECVLYFGSQTAER